MTDILADWYFTRCVNLPAGQDQQLLDDLQRLRLESLSPHRLSEAIDRLVAVDQRARAYALPDLVSISIDGEDQEVREQAADAVAAIVSAPLVGALKSSTVGLIELLPAALDLNGSDVDFIRPLTMLADRALEHVTIDEVTPYFGIASQALHLLILAIAERLATDPEHEASIAEQLASCRGDEPDGSLATLTLRAAAGAFGRRPLLLAIRLIAAACEPARAIELISRVHHSDESMACGYEPDLVVTAALTQPLSSGVEAVLLQTGLQEFIGTGDRAPSPRVLRRLGITAREARVLRVVIWQLAQLDSGVNRNELEAAELRAIFRPRPASGAACVLPSDAQHTHRLAQQLAAVSGSEAAFKLAKKRESASDPRTAVHLLAGPWPAVRFEADQVHFRSLDKCAGVIRLCLGALTVAERASRLGADTDQTLTDLAPLLIFAEVELSTGPSDRRTGPAAWTALVRATLATLAEITSGHVRSIAPDDLDDWVTETESALAELGPAHPATERVVNAILDRPLTWAMYAAPRLDEIDGSGRWSALIPEVISYDLDADGTAGVSATVLRDIVHRLEICEYPAGGGRTTAPWRELRQTGTTTAHDVLLSATDRYEEWETEVGRELSDAARAAVAVRRMECVPHDDVDVVDRSYRAFADALAALPPVSHDNFYVLLRAVGLLSRPALRSSPERAEQLSVLALATDQPLLWRYMYRQLAQVNPAVAFSALDAGLRRLLELGASTRSAVRLRREWCAALADLLKTCSPDSAAAQSGLKLLRDRVESDSGGFAATRATPHPLTLRDLERRQFSASENGVAGAAWRARAVVLDPIHDHHGAWLDAVDSLDLAGRFLPTQRRSIASVIVLDDDARSALVNVGEPQLRPARIHGAAPDVGELVRLTTEDHRCVLTRIQSCPVLSYATTVLVEPKETRAGAGRLLAVQPAPGLERQDVDPRLWDADTARAFASVSDRYHVPAILDGDNGWVPVARDGVGLVLALATSGQPLTVVYNARCDGGWLVSAAPGECYRLLRTDLDDDTADAFDDCLAEQADPNGLLVTLCLKPGLQVGLYSGPHSTDIHGALDCPVDDRNLLWRSVTDPYRDGVLLGSVDGAWHLPVVAPAPPFPDRLELDVTIEDRADRRSAGKGQQLVVSLDDFRDAAQRTGRLGGRVVGSFALKGNPNELVDQLLHADQPFEAVLSRVIAQGQSADAVRCATEAGYSVLLNPEQLSLLPMRGDALRSIDVAGWKVAVNPPKRMFEGGWVALSEHAAVGVRPHLSATRPTVSGVVWSRPRDHAGSTTVEVRLDLSAQGFPATAVDVGAVAHAGDVVRFRLDVNTDVVEGRLDRPLRSADRLYEPMELRQAAPGSVVVGRQQVGGNEATTVIRGPDNTIHLLADDSVPALFSEYDGREWVATGSSSDIWHLDRPPQGDRAARVTLSRPSTTLSGWVQQPRLTQGAVTLREVSLQMRQRLGRWTLSRELILSNVKRQPAMQRRHQPIAPDADEPQLDIRVELEQLYAAGKPLAVALAVGQPPRARVLELVQLGAASQEATLVLVDDEPVLVSAGEGEYDRQAARAQLVALDDERFGLSCRQVPSLDLTEYAETLGAGIGRRVDTPHLHYAMEVDGCHILEFGYGRRVAVDEDHLRFDGDPFSAAKGVIFHGDRLGAVVFRDIAGELVLDVISASVQGSVGTSLYEQATRHSFLHLLSVEAVGEHLGVHEIQGFTRRSAELGAKRTFVDPRASLHAADASTLLAELAPGERRVIYGQLDTELFLNSAGLTLKFFRRSLTADSVTAAGKYVVTFLRAGAVRSIGIEMGLEVTSASDRHDDLPKSLMVIRRNFSVDVNQLPRLARLVGNEALDGSLIVAALTPDERRKGILTSLIHSAIPDRLNSSLRDLSKPDGVLLLVHHVRRGREGAAVRLEFRYGIHFTLRQDEIDDMPSDLAARDVVRATWSAASGRFTLARCVPSDLWFFRSRPRPLVALPTNPVLAKDASAALTTGARWREAAFVAGGLPGAVASPASDAPASAWSDPAPRDMAELMRRPHPKVGGFGLSGNRLRMRPELGPTGAGAVSFGDRQVTVSIDGVAKQVDPAQLTFGDESVAETAARAAGASWQFHDEQTGHWTKNGIDRLPLPEHQLSDGPVFFEGNRLRYLDDLRWRSYPSTFLAQGIRHSGRLPVVVAGHSTDQAGDVNGLYLEVVPGVVCLVLGTLLGFRLADGRASSLETVALTSFGVGDRLELEISQDPSRSVDSIVASLWTPSGRVLGSSQDENWPGFIAPVQGFDETAGRLRLGAGNLIIDIPTFRRPSTRVVRLLASNKIVEELGRGRRATAVLMIEDDRLVVAGFPGLQVRAAKSGWGNSPHHAHLFDDKGRPHFGLLKADVIAAGGALGITVEYVDDKGRALYFSFRHQLDHLRGERTLLGQVVGADGRDFMVRTGPAIIRIAADRVVAGIPTTATADVATAMRTGGTVVWLDANDGCWTGRPTVAASGVGSFAAVVDVDGEITAGIVARESGSHALVWLPAIELALADLTSAERRLLWVSGAHPRFDAQVDDNGQASILQHPAVVKERAGLYVGSALDVTVRARTHRDGLEHFLAGTRSGVVVEVHRAQMADIEVGDQLTVEIQSIERAGRRVTTVPAGARQANLSLPTILFSHLPATGTRRPSFDAFVATLLGRASMPEHSPEEALARAGAAVLAGTPSAQGAADAAAWWKRAHPEEDVELLPMLMAATVLLAASTAAPDALMADCAVDHEVLPASQQAWSQRAAEVLGSLGRRSLCSLHIEVLTRYWLKQRHRHEGVGWRRLELLAAHLARPVPSTWREDTAPVLRQLEFGSGREGRLTAAALRVAGGSVDDAGHLLQDADLVLPEVVRIARIANPSLYSPGGTHRFFRPALEVAALQQSMLTRLIHRLCDNNDDIVLLADPPWFGASGARQHHRH